MLTKTEHILYIVTNARYHCGFGDSDEFNNSLSILKKLPSLSPLGFNGESYQIDYISGMYPELEEPIKYFNSKVHPTLSQNKLLPDETLHRYATETIKKFGLSSGYDLNKSPDIAQLVRLNHRILPKQRKDLKNLAPEFLKEIGLALSELTQDYRIVDKFMCICGAMESILSGKISAETAQKFIDIPGVTQALACLSLIDQGIIDKDLKILDWERLCKSKQITEFDLGNGKIYNLANTINRPKKTYKTTINIVKDIISKTLSDRK